MNWLSPLACGRIGTKGIIVHGRTYPSIVAACRDLQCSYTKIYRLIGEGWRNAKERYKC